MKALVVGAGIGGLSAALSLRQAGIDVEVFEAVEELHPLGVGINLQPHAVRELTEMGLAGSVGATAIPTATLAYFNSHGQLIHSEPRGLGAGYRWPQYSVSRGELELVLLRATLEQIGEASVHTGHRAASFEQDDDGVTLRFVDRSGVPIGSASGDLLVGADGLHSTIRAILYPDEGLPVYSGKMHWRGVVEGDPFLDGRTQAIVGHRRHRIVLYPISAEAERRGRAMVNFVVELERPSDRPPRADWNELAPIATFADAYASWRFPWLDVPALLAAAGSASAFPEVDRDPVGQWSFGSVTLLGDAAHPMHPTGAQAGSQAIADARYLTRALLLEPTIESALRRYESERLPTMNEIVLRNRQSGPEAVINIVEDRAPNGFQRLHDVLTQEEIDEITGSYKRAAGFDAESLNARPSLLLDLPG